MTASYTQTPSILREPDSPIHRKLKDIGWKWRRKLTHHLRSSSHICISEPRVVWGECTQGLHLQGRQDYISQHTSCSRGNLADRSTLKSWFQVMRVCKCFIFSCCFQHLLHLLDDWLGAMSVTVHVWISEDNLWGAGSFLPPHESWRSNSYSQAWWQAASHTEASH